MRELDSDVVRICEESFRFRTPGGHGTQLQRIYELAGLPVPDQVLGKRDCFYFIKGIRDIMNFWNVVRLARCRLNEQIPQSWMAL